MTTLDEMLPEGAIRTQVDVTDWRGAIRAVGELLVAQGATTPVYTDEMIAAVETLGPYIVIAPGFALAHSRPSAAVLKTGVAWVSLENPVDFGNPENDPVRLVVGLAATDHDAHLQTMAALAATLSDEELLTRLLDAPTPEGVRALLSGAQH